jgi:hypothetical protein
MNEPMPTPTWDEYLAAASAHLRAARTATEECRNAALTLALGYDLLAEEVVARMSVIEQRRPSTTRLHAPPGQRPPRYIDTPA